MIKLEHWMVTDVVKGVTSALYHRNSGTHVSFLWRDDEMFGGDDALGVTVNHLHDTDIINVVEYQYNLPMKVESYSSLNEFSKAYQ